jgi:cytochrome c oxidase cbb3-type subunit I
MDFTVGVLLGTFLLSILALFIFIWSMSTGSFGDGTAAATEIFAPNELGQIEDPAATAPLARRCW